MGPLPAHGHGTTVRVPATAAVGTTGGNQPVPLRNPYLSMRHCIVVNGIFPSRP